MLNRHKHGCPRDCRGAAAAELALLLPFLGFLFVITLDFGRIFYYTLTIENAARNGALWACDPYAPGQSYSSLQNAVQADASNIQPPIQNSNISSSTGTDANGNAVVSVTVTYDFTLISNYPGIPNPYTISRTVEMRQEATTPTNFPVVSQGGP
ncbi:MAG TPA: TadE/TadG family type IV pilus assembly protein [Gemmataceae bacterium]